MFACLAALNATAMPSAHTLWTIGEADNSADEFALAPNGFRQFLAKDFGYEDKYYMVGFSAPDHDFPYVLPGPTDTWGGTWSTAGWRTHQVNVLFCLDKKTITVTTNLCSTLPTMPKPTCPGKVSVNDQTAYYPLSAEGKYAVPQRKAGTCEAATDTLSLSGDLSEATPAESQCRSIKACSATAVMRCR